MSNETPWTPGPWKHESMTPAVGGPNRCCVATVSFAHQSGDVESDRQAYANARLIAAAPEMAAMLERMTNAAERRLRELRALNSIDALQLTNDIADARALLAKIKKGA